MFAHAMSAGAFHHTQHLERVIAGQDRDADWFEQPELDRAKVLYMNSCFITKLCQEVGGYNYSNVQRWTAPRKLRRIGVDRYQGIRDVDKVVIPVHLGNHWVWQRFPLQRRCACVRLLHGLDVFV
jgi:hypothetical protein